MSAWQNWQKMTMNKETEMNQVVKKEQGALQQSAPLNPMQLIEKALETGNGVEQLDKLYALQERWEANEAKKAYVAAMNEFKANPPLLYKDKSVNAGKASYDHISLEFASRAIGNALVKYGFSHRWETDTENGVKVSCIITHDQGHSERSTLQAPADTSGSKNNVQAIGSTVTYLQRYTLLAITGLAVHGQDDDGLATSELNEDEFDEITALIDEAGISTQKFCEHFKIESVNRLLGSDYRRAKLLLNQRIKQNKGENNG